MAWDSLLRLRHWPMPRPLGKWWVLYVRSPKVMPVDTLVSAYDGPLRLD